MTLVQVLADSQSVHMACDFRLTDARSGLLIQDDAHKLVSSGRAGSALIGVTGVAVLEGLPIATWLVRALGDAPLDFDAVVASLREAAEPCLMQVRNALFRRTTFVVAGVVGAHTRIALVSNFEGVILGRIQRSIEAAETLAVSLLRPKRPLYFVTGVQNVVERAAQEEVRRLLHTGLPDDRIQGVLARLNAEASRSSAAISEGCYVASQHVTGRGSSRPFLTDGQTGDFISPDLEDRLRREGLELLAKNGPDGRRQPIREVGRSSAFSGSGEAYFHTQLKLRPTDAELWNNYGSELASRGRHQRAATAYERAIELAPDRPLPYSNLASLRWATAADSSDAQILYDHAFDLWGAEPPTWALVRYAEFRFSAFGDVEGSTSLFRRAATDPNSHLARAHLALHLLRTGDTSDEAPGLIAEALHAASNLPDVLGVVGRAEFDYLGKREDGRAHVERAVQLEPHSLHLLVSAAEVCLLSGDGTTSSYYFRKAADRGATGWSLHANWGLALLLARKVDGALRHLEAARADAPVENMPLVEINLAAAHWVKGDKSTALSTLNRLSHAKGLNPSWELEIAAMLVLAGQDEMELRVQELLSQDVTSDALTLQAMTAASSDAEHLKGDDLARFVSGIALAPTSPSRLRYATRGPSRESRRR